MIEVKKFKSKILQTHKSTDPEAMHILLLMGGMSAEKEVSLSSGKEVLKGLIAMDYNVTAVDMGSDIASLIEKIDPDLVFNSLHGTHGEDGCVPGMLEILGIPYTHSGVLPSAIALDKINSQKLFTASKIKCPKRVIVSKHNNFNPEPIARPYIIKPVSEGSSIGVVTVFPEDSHSILDYEFKYGELAIVEEFIEGKEIQVAVVSGKAIGTLEIVPLKSRFYDYEAKYVPGMADHFYPARLSPENIEKALKISESVCKLIDCKGAPRVEFRYSEREDELYFIEINTHPGFTKTSIVPEIAQNNGISFNQLLQLLIDESINEHVREKI